MRFLALPHRSLRQSRSVLCSPDWRRTSVPGAAGECGSSTWKRSSIGRC